MRYIIIVLVTFFSFFTLNLKAETETTCVRNADGEIIVANDSNIVTDTDGNQGDSCKEVPDVYRLKFYKVGMCTANPIASEPTDYSTCSYFLDNTTGTTLDITMPATSDLAITSLPENGTYGYMIMLISNGLQLKHTETFSAAVKGKGGTAGKFCSTNSAITAYGDIKTSGDIGDPVATDVSDTSTLGMTCASSAPTAEFTTEYVDTFGDGSFVANTAEGFTLTGGVMTARLLQNDNTTTATSGDNAERAAVAFTFTTPQVVTASSQYELNFKINSSVSVDLAYSGGSVWAVKNGADPFQVYMNISN